MSTIKLKGSSSGEAEVTVAAAAGTPTFTLPTTVGSANQHLKTDGSGALSWATPTALTGSTNNTVCTVTGANAIQGEANLTFDGSILQAQDSTGTTPGTAQLVIRKGAGAGAANEAFTRANSYIHLGGSEWGTNSAGLYALSFGYSQGVGATYTPAYLGFKETSSAGHTKGDLVFATRDATSDSEPTEKLRVQGDGNVKINDGDLVIGTAGHGIDFSVNAHDSGMSSETLSEYEYGTWTPVVKKGGTNLGSVTNQWGYYTKVGKVVHISFYYYKAWDGTGIAGTGSWTVSLPFSTLGGGTAGYSFVPCGYLSINGGTNTNDNLARWQQNSGNSTAVTLYSSIHNVAWTSGGVEFSGCGTLTLTN